MYLGEKEKRGKEDIEKRKKEKKRKREKEKKRIDSLYFNNIKTFLLFTFLILQALS